MTDLNAALNEVVMSAAVRRNVFIVKDDSPKASALSHGFLATVVAELVKLGYVADLDQLKGLSENEAVSLLKALSKFKGTNLRWVPFYPNFPQQVMESSESDLVFNALIHYLSRGTVNPVENTPVVARTPVVKVGEKSLAFDNLTMLKGVSVDSLFLNVFDAFESPVSVSPEIMDELDSLISYASLSVVTKAVDGFETKNKENWLILGQAIEGDSFDFYLDTAKTATDVLRAVVFQSSLEDAIQLGRVPNLVVKLSRSQRKSVMLTLDKLARDGEMSIKKGQSSLKFNSVLDDMYSYKKLWKRISSSLHPFDFKRQAPVAVDVYSAVLGNDNAVYKRFNSIVEQKVEEGNILDAAALLSYKPGRFVRSYDWLVRSAKDENEAMKVISLFNTLKTKIQTNTLISAYNGIINRDKTHVTTRVNGGKHIERVRELPSISPDVVDVMLNSIVNKIRGNNFDSSQLEGKVFVDPVLKGISVPLNVRDSSKGRVLPSGSKVKLGTDSPIIRMFTHWENHKTRVDIDLSAVFYGENSDNKDYVNYTRLKNGFAVHSGDYVDAPAPHGATEFVDIDVEKALAAGVRYVEMDIRSYAGVPLKEMGQEEKLFAGVSFPEDGQTGELFDLAHNPWSFTPSGEAKFSMSVFVFDLVEGEMMWVDGNLSTGSFASGVHQPESDSSFGVISSMFNSKFFSLYDLFVTHLGEGQAVEERDEADTVVSIGDSDVDIFDSSSLMAFL